MNILRRIQKKTVSNGDLQIILLPWTDVFCWILRGSAPLDDGGVLCRGERIAPEGPAAYFSTLPVEAMSQAIRDAGLPGQVSTTAGTYVCTDVLYTLLHHVAGSDTRVGFIHVPYLPGQGEPSMPLADTVKALEQAILAIG